VPVLIRHRAPGMTLENYDELSPPLIEEIKRAPGFKLHVAFEDANGLCVAEIWDTKEQHDSYFNVKPSQSLWQIDLRCGRYAARWPQHCKSMNVVPQRPGSLSSASPSFRSCSSSLAVTKDSNRCSNAVANCNGTRR
jgi:hypothetical protein